MIPKTYLFRQGLLIECKLKVDILKDYRKCHDHGLSLQVLVAGWTCRRIGSLMAPAIHALLVEGMLAILNGVGLLLCDRFVAYGALLLWDSLASS